jgi:hypothetical protein
MSIEAENRFVVLWAWERGAGMKNANMLKLGCDDGCVRKNTAHKESSQEKSHVHTAKFNGRPKLPGWPGKKWRTSDSGQGVAFIKGGG